MFVSSPYLQRSPFLPLLPPLPHQILCLIVLISIHTQTYWENSLYSPSYYLTSHLPSVHFVGSLSLYSSQSILNKATVTSILTKSKEISQSLPLSNLQKYYIWHSQQFPPAKPLPMGFTTLNYLLFFSLLFLLSFLGDYSLSVCSLPQWFPHLEVPQSYQGCMLKCRSDSRVPHPIYLDVMVFRQAQDTIFYKPYFPGAHGLWTAILKTALILGGPQLGHFDSSPSILLFKFHLAEGISYHLEPAFYL